MSNKSLKVINIDEWIDLNIDNFKPPVCNKLMHNDQLLVQFVGGPNKRADYHIEEGEEVFYQIKGDMCVKIIENGQHKDIYIKEGEFFILPARIPHSPQRNSDTIGLVIERKREPNERDAVRWYVPDTTNVLYEKWFNCKNLGIELVPLINSYFASEEHKSKQPGTNVEDENKLPYKLNTNLIQKENHGPFLLLERIKLSKESIIDLTPIELNLQFDIKAYRKGIHFISDLNGKDVWFMQLTGSGKISIQTPMKREEDYFLNLRDSLLVPDNYCQQVTINIQDDSSCLLKFTQELNRNR